MGSIDGYVFTTHVRHQYWGTVLHMLFSSISHNKAEINTWSTDHEVHVNNVE